MRYGSLCSGIGGLDRAIERVLSVTPAWFCEADKHAASVLRRWWPDVPVLPDLKTQDWTQVESVELVSAGYPCQPFSQAGRRRGEDDPRHLWPFVLDAVRVLRPRLVVLENVSGHLGLGFGTVLGDLAEAGFDAEWSIVRASDVGACHRRERLFVLAWDPTCEQMGTTGQPRQGARVPTAESGCAGARRVARAVSRTSTPGEAERGADVRALVDAGADASDANGGRLEVGSQLDSDTPQGAADRRSRRRHADGCGEQAASNTDDRADDRQRPRSESRQGSPVASDPDDLGLQRGGVHGDGGRDLRTTVADAYGVAGAQTEPEHRRPGTVGEPGTVERVERLHRVAWGDYGAAIERWERALGRIAPDPLDEKGRLNVAFVEWMQGFDAGWVSDLTRTAALRCLGNSVVQQQGALAIAALSERVGTDAISLDDSRRLGATHSDQTKQQKEGP